MLKNTQNQTSKCEQQLFSCLKPTLSLRPYQQSCIDAVLSAIKRQQEYSLVVLPTGGGKTIIFSELIRKFFELWGRHGIRICVLAHREKLVSQAYEKLLRVWPEAAMRTGIACAGISSKINLDADIVIGTVQTVCSQLERTTIRPFNAVLIDEAHRIPYMTENGLAQGDNPSLRGYSPVFAKDDSQYAKILQLTKAMREQRKVIGFTATPFRLGHGFIFGNGCKQGHKNWFPIDPVFSLPLGDMIADKYLVPYRLKEVKRIDTELMGNVSLSCGDWNQTELANFMTRYTSLAVSTVKENASDRKRIVIFCATIDHSEKVAKAFTESGISCAHLHSGMDSEEKKGVLSSFSEGKIRVLASVDMLIEGWDETSVDCIVMLRPTKSPAIYIQQTGRGLRLHPGKDDLMILDLANNARTHGMPHIPIVRIPGEKKGSEPFVKICPSCGFASPPNTQKCAQCGYEWPLEKSIAVKPKRVLMEEKKVNLAPFECAINKISIEPRDNRFLIIRFGLKDAPDPWKEGSLVLGANVFSENNFSERWTNLTGSLVTPKYFNAMKCALLKVDWPEKGYFVETVNKKGYRNLSFVAFDLAKPVRKSSR